MQQKSPSPSPIRRSVKTAIAGEDPNWGRIVAAIGKSGAAAERDRLSIRFGDILVADKGWRHPAYREEDGAAYMKQPELIIQVGLGSWGARAHGLDLRPDRPLCGDQRGLPLLIPFHLGKNTPGVRGQRPRPSARKDHR